MTDAGATTDAEVARGPRWHVPLLVLFGLPVFFLGLGSYSVVNGDEGYYHAAAVRMVETGDWFTLDFHGQHRVYDTFMNAPTQYWARAVLIALFGDNLWTMRLLSAAFGLLTVLAVYRLVAEIEPTPRRVPALLAALVQLTTYQYVYLHGARTGELDSIVGFLMTVLALLFARALRTGGSFAPHHACLALLLTVKVPAVLIPVAAELALFATTPAARPCFRRYALSGLAIVPLGLVWHATQAVRFWDEALGVFGKMSGQATGDVGGGDTTGDPLSNARWYASKMLFGAFPWSLAMVPAVVSAAARALRGGERERVGWRAALCFAGAVLLFFVFVSKRFPWYVLPAYPFLAACVGAWVARLGRPAPRAKGAAEALVVAAVLALALWIVVPLDLRPLTMRAPLVPMVSAWRPSSMGLPVGLGVTFALAAVALLWLRARSGACLAGALFAVLFGYAAVRVALPLRTLEYTSALERLSDEVHAALGSGGKIVYPLKIPDAEGYLKINYYFARDFVVGRRTFRVQAGRSEHPMMVIEGPRERGSGRFDGLEEDEGDTEP